MKVVRGRDILVTLACWLWFIPGFFLFFSWRYAWAALFPSSREKAFQRLNSRFFGILLEIVRRLAPDLSWDIDPRAAAIRSSVVVCNHLSYLDPLLLIALFERHRTIVKTSFFSVPLFGSIMIASGYMPAMGEGRFARLMLDRMESMGHFFADGGILFVFPEGTRRRDGRPGELQQGALKIARSCRVPVQVLQLVNTDRLFTPGDFFFHAARKNTIRLSVLAKIETCTSGGQLSASQLEQAVCRVYENAAAQKNREAQQS